MRTSFLIIVILFCVFELQAQKQFILLKRQSVVARFSEGEYIRLKLKNGSFREGRIMQLQDGLIITSNDTIPFISIGKINVKGHRKKDTQSSLGKLLLIAGVGYFAIDRVNTWFFVEGQSGLDEGVSITSAALAGTGALLLFAKSPYMKVRGLSMRTIDYTSRFYE